MPVAELEKIAVSIFGNDRVFPVQTLEGALDCAVEKVQRPLSDDSVGVVVTGSVVTVGEARTYLRKKFNK
jgi:dihydrofolate synthase/folylpolyglutamate synthase